jgi:thioredoxin-like negative regulator of GroEL
METWRPEDLQERLDRGERVFVKLWKKGCGPCKLSTPAVERLEAHNRFNLTFGQICADDYPEILEITGSDVLPAFFVFNEEGLKGTFKGFKGLQKLEEFLQESLGSASLGG